jgi:hypothetical protein
MGDAPPVRCPFSLASGGGNWYNLHNPTRKERKATRRKKMAIEKTYLHTGIPVAAKMPKMAYMKALKVWIANNTEYGIEYLYWEKDTPAAFRMVTESHVAYKVKDVAAAVKAAKGAVLLAPMAIGPTAKIAFVSIKNGPVVEFYQD